MKSVTRDDERYKRKYGKRETGVEWLRKGETWLRRQAPPTHLPCDETGSGDDQTRWERATGELGDVKQGTAFTQEETAQQIRQSPSIRPFGPSLQCVWSTGRCQVGTKTSEAVFPRASVAMLAETT